jgi:hypothetical protein
MALIFYSSRKGYDDLTLEQRPEERDGGDQR